MNDQPDSEDGNADMYHFRSRWDVGLFLALIFALLVIVLYLVVHRSTGV